MIPDAIKEIAKALQSVLFKLHINGYSSLLHPLGVNNVDFILKFYVVKDGENDSLRVINVYHKLCGEAEDSWLEIEQLPGRVLVYLYDAKNRSFFVANVSLIQFMS